MRETRSVAEPSSTTASEQAFPRRSRSRSLASAWLGHPAVRASAAVVWLAVVTVAYYAVHKPFTLENVLAVLNIAADLAVGVVICTAAAALGHRLLRAVAFDDPLIAVPVELGIGFGVVSVSTLILGLAGLLYAWLFWALLGLSAVVLHRDLVEFWRAVRSIRLAPGTRLERGAALFTALAVIVSLLLALTPPTGWDALQYHLVGPQLALQQGRIAAPPDNVSLNYPGLVEMLFLAAMRLKGDVAAQLLHWVYLPLTLAVVLALGRRYFSSRVGWLAIALLAAVPTFLQTAATAYNDLALAFYTVAGLALVLEASETGTLSRFVLAGALAGMAMGEKYTAAFVLFAILAAAFAVCKIHWREVAVFGVAAGVVASPWYLRNWLLVGNPVYPFLWGGSGWDAFRASWYSRFGTGLANDPLRLLIAPWEATAGPTDPYQAAVGPLLLALVPLWLITLRATTSRAAKPLWVFTGVLYLVWLVGVAESKLLWQTRLLFPAFPALALLAAEGYERLGAIRLRAFSVQRFTGLAIGILLALTAISYTLSILESRPFPYLVGFETRDQFLSRQLGSYYAAIQYVNRELPPNAKVLFLWETRGYYASRPANADAILDRWSHLVSQYGTADRIAQTLAQEGYTHVFLYRSGLDFLVQTGYDPISDRDLAVLSEIEGRYWRLIYGHTMLQWEQRNGRPGLVNTGSDPYVVYEITKGSPRP